MPDAILESAKASTPKGGRLHVSPVVPVVCAQCALGGLTVSADTPTRELQATEDGVMLGEHPRHKETGCLISN